MKLSMAAQWTSGELMGRDVEFLGVSTDTRQIELGNLFVALRGDNFDGNDFLEDAARQGAAAAITERDTDAFPGYVRVTDGRRALGLLAAGWFMQFSLPSIAVTGSAGKTTVKEMLAQMLGGEVLATHGNLNNDIGVPLTLLRAGAEHRYAVIELGANAPGEIGWTTTLVQPRVAMVTNVGGAHLEGFGSMRGIAEAKSEIFRGVPEGGTAVINMDDDWADFFVERAEKRGLHLVRVGLDGPRDLVARDIVAEGDGVRFVLVAGELERAVRLPLPGRHQVSNALMALGAIQALGLPLEPALERLAGLKSVPGRIHRDACGAGILLDDSYNASPGSVRAAIEVLAGMPAPRALVLGAMAELGAESPALHESLGREARQAGIEQLITVAAEAAQAAKGFGAGARALADHDEAVREAWPVLEAGGTVLVKGSRTTRMDRVVEGLRAMGGEH